MPRARKTQTGAPAQPLAAVPGQTYGMGADQQQLQEAMPTPNVQRQVTAAMQQPAQPGAQPAPAPAAQPAPPMDPMEAARMLQGRTGLLTQPTARPGEPITQGLPIGPGAGPEVMVGSTGSPTGDALRNLSRQTGNPYFAQLAMRTGV